MQFHTVFARFLLAVVTGFFLIVTLFSLSHLSLFLVRVLLAFPWSFLLVSCCFLRCLLILNLPFLISFLLRRLNLKSCQNPPQKCLANSQSPQEDPKAPASEPPFLLLVSSLQRHYPHRKSHFCFPNPSPGRRHSRLLRWVHLEPPRELSNLLEVILGEFVKGIWITWRLGFCGFAFSESNGCLKRCTRSSVPGRHCGI